MIDRNEKIKELEVEAAGYSNGHLSFMMVDLSQEACEFVVSRLIELSEMIPISGLNFSTQNNRKTCLRFETQEKYSIVPNVIYEFMPRTFEKECRLYQFDSWESLQLRVYGVYKTESDKFRSYKCGNGARYMPLYGPEKPFTATVRMVEDYIEDNVPYANVEICIKDNESGENMIIGGNMLNADQRADLLSLTGMLPEPLYWMNRNIGGLEETGVLMTRGDVLKQTDLTGDDLRLLDEIINQSGFPDVCAGIDGCYRGNDTFILYKIRNMDELYDLITWKNFDFQCSCAASYMDEDYPEYVDESLKIGMCVYNTTGYTSKENPDGSASKTLAKYAKVWLDIPEDMLRYRYSDIEKAQAEISVLVHENKITLEDYFSILLKYNLKEQKTNFFKLVSEALGLS